ncbi:MAG: type II secretion system F family protein [Candidatus Solibacter usitatus]|nr:type II secretion system F family protein [Candidatus Solibacter usitatus]
MNILIIGVVIWICAMVAWYLMSGAFKSADVDKVKQRLVGNQKKTKDKKEPGEAGAAQLLSLDKKTPGKIVSHLLEKYRVTDRLRDLLEQAGLKWHVVSFVHACMGGFIAGYLIAWMLVDMRAVALAGAAFGGSLPLLFVMRKRSSRMEKFGELFPDSLEFVSRSMRAGHAFSVSLEMLHREFPEPLSTEFRRTFEEHNLGLPLDMALQKLAKRVPSLDVHFFVSAVLLQKRTGGNLAEILDKLAYVIRERFKLHGRIKAVSAHGKMTGTALSLIPCGVAVILFYVNPMYSAFFFSDETGQWLAAGSIALQVLGYAIIRKIVSIEV